MTLGEDLLAPGRNCWRIEQAERLAVIVDAEDYFRVAKEAMLRARHSVHLIGWDFDTRIRFEPGGKTLEGPNRLGPFLRWLDRNRPELRVHVLKWDVGALFAIARGMPPLFVMNWLTSERMRFKLDSAHPTGSAQHQKIVVVDDVLAFCGGLDMTARRWDTRDHHDDDRRRLGYRHDPWHDATTAVDGAVAKAIGELARARWHAATGEELSPPPPLDAIWPDGLSPTFENVDVAIARTMPSCGAQREVREIERLYLDAIAAARKTIYCETQYFASDRIAQAMARRLQEPDGPEIVIINPKNAEGIMESQVMDTSRSRLLRRIPGFDREDRFLICHPVTRGQRPIYVHAKILIVDDRLLRVGSSNLNNRSMGFDSECDIAIAASAAEVDRRNTITDVRNDLLAEHLDCGRDEVAGAIEAAGGSLVRAVRTLCAANAGSRRRSLKPVVPAPNSVLDDLAAESKLLDPDRPPMPFRRTRVRLRQWFSRRDRSSRRLTRHLTDGPAVPPFPALAGARP